MARGEYQFVAWVRTGIGAVLDGAMRDVTLELGAAGDVAVPVTPYGPGDAAGLGPGAVVRMVPPPNVSDFEPNLFPAVELAHPALPWMLSPPATAGRAMPWLVLIVVEDRPGVTLARTGERTLLSIESPADPTLELPDLSQSWAWAHAQAIGVVGGALDTGDLARSRGEGRARLVCPRRLVAGRRYLACVVPAFAAGVAAALGQTIPAGTAPAWTRPVQAPIRLPVFHAWHFGTGPGGDFASLAERLVPQQLDESIGHRLVDASRPGFGAPDVPGLAIDVPGALVSAKWEPAAAPGGAAIVGDAILAAIDAAATPPASMAATFPPAFYGASATRANRTADSPAWQDRLNRDLDERIAAGLGAEVVRATQDELVEAAWSAAGEAERATTVMRQCELAEAVTRRLVARHVVPLEDDGDVLGIARPLLARIRMRETAGQRTISRELSTSVMPSAALSPSLRRIARPGAAIGRRASARAGRVLERADSGALRPAPPLELPDGAAAFNAVSADERMQPRWRSATAEAIDASQIHWKGEVDRRRRAGPSPVIALRRRTDIPDGEIETTPPLPSDDPDPITIDEFAAAARRHQTYLYSTIHPPRPLKSLGTFGARPLVAVRATIVESLDPQPVLAAHLGIRITGIAVDASTSSVTIRPVLERPLITALAKLDPDHVLPNIAKIEADRVAVAVPQHAMVRAFLVGANDELGRELLWRGFPGALGHTWLRTFWGRTAVGANGARIAVPDIDAIESWPEDGPALAAAQLVLVIRGELLRRYPNTLVYAVPASWSGRHRAPRAETLYPTIAQTIAGDVALFGFDLDETTARGGDQPGGPAGWYFMIEEHPSEPRFGLAVSSATLATWHELAWDDVTPLDLAGEHLRVDGPLEQLHPSDPAGLAWGHDAAQLAAITYRRPTRVAFHASLLLP